MFNILENILKSSLSPIDSHYSQILYLQTYLPAQIYL